jgi:hypothetical protein
MENYFLDFPWDSKYLSFFFYELGGGIPTKHVSVDMTVDMCTRSNHVKDLKTHFPK